MDNCITKRCKNGDKCVHPLGAEQPADREHFWVEKENRDGLQGTCKACRNAERNARYNSRPDVVAAREERKRLDALKPPPDVMNKIRQDRYIARHPERVKQSKRDWKLRNPNKVKADNRSDRAKRKAKEWAAKHPDKRKEIEKRYRDNNPHLSVLRTQRRNTRKRSFPVDFTKEDWKACLAYWDNRCAYCGNQQGLFYNLTITLDHFIPLMNPNNPGTVKGNIVPACLACNSSKGEHDASEWLTKRYGKRKANQILKRIEGYFKSLE